MVLGRFSVLARHLSRGLTKRRGEKGAGGALSERSSQPLIALTLHFSCSQNERVLPQGQETFRNLASPLRKRVPNLVRPLEPSHVPPKWQGLPPPPPTPPVAHFRLQRPAAPRPAAAWPRPAVPPVNIRFNPTTKIGKLTWGGEFTWPKVVPLGLNRFNFSS